MSDAQAGPVRHHLKASPKQRYVTLLGADAFSPSIVASIQSKLETSGWVWTESPEQAHIWVDIRLLSIGNESDDKIASADEWSTLEALQQRLKSDQKRADKMESLQMYRLLHPTHINSGLPAALRCIQLEHPHLHFQSISVDDVLLSTLANHNTQPSTKQETAVSALVQAIIGQSLFAGRRVSTSGIYDRHTYALTASERASDANLARRLQALVQEHTQRHSKFHIVVSGGARGITATCIQSWMTMLHAVDASLAQTICFSLLGRTTSNQQLDPYTQLHQQRDLQRAIHDQEKCTLAEARTRAQRILGVREVRQTIETLQSLGAKVQLLACDISESTQVTQAIKQAKASFGPIHGLIHGAGVNADRHFVDKTESDWRWVHAVKCGGFEHLVRETQSEALRFGIAFSSIAALTGNAGQSDYGAANARIDQSIAQLNQQTKAQTRWLSLGWGPWDGGMVNPTLKRYFEKKKIPLIASEQGGLAFVEEWVALLESAEANHDQKSPYRYDAVVLGHRPQELALRTASTLELGLTVSDRLFPELAAHRPKQQQAVPVVMVLDWVHHVMQAAFYLEAPSFFDVRVLKGITLQPQQSIALHFHIVREDDNRLQIKIYQQSADLNLEKTPPNYTLRAEQNETSTKNSKHLFDTGESLSALFASQHSAEHQGQPSEQEQGWETTKYGTSLPLFHDAPLRIMKRYRPSEHTWKASIEQQSATPRIRRVAALDSALQLAVLWTHHQSGGQALPTSIARVQWTPMLDQSSALELHPTRSHAMGGQSSAMLTLPNGQPAAAFIDIQTHRLPDEQQ